jgi:hypothetical protein
MFGRTIHSIPISKINSEIAIALFCAFENIPLPEQNPKV